MPRDGHADLSKIVPQPVRKGAMISLPSDDSFGYSRKPAPSDGIYFEIHDGGFFVDIKEMDAALDALHLSISNDEQLAQVEAAAPSDET